MNDNETTVELKLSRDSSSSEVQKKLWKHRKQALYIEKLLLDTGLSQEQLYALLQLRIDVPVSVFNGLLSPLQALVTYLKNHHGLNFHQIALCLGRDERNIWHSYVPHQKIEVDSSVSIPLSWFASRSLSILEHVVHYLVDKAKLTRNEISLLLRKHPTTIWSVQKRLARKSYGHHFDFEHIQNQITGLSVVSQISYSILLKEQLLGGYSTALPLRIFRGGKSFTKLCKYLHQELGLSISEIARLVNRDVKTIWSVLDDEASSKIKTPSEFGELSVPLALFTDRTLSVLEHLVKYCKEELEMSYSEIADQLLLNYKTIWTAYHRSKGGSS